MDPRYRIVSARPDDVSSLPAIELAAARMLADFLSESDLAETSDVAQLEGARREGHLWVALAGDAPVGFAHVRLLEPMTAHLEELDVHPSHGRRGIGRRLVTTVCDWAAANAFRSVTLTTFREPPWNMPFYSTLGFEVLASTALRPALDSVMRDEALKGLDPARRVVMERACGRARGA